MFAETENGHEKTWKDLCSEFDDQRAIFRYFYGTYMPVRAPWARCFIRKYRNFGIRVTSGTDASNNNVKSYLLNGISHLYRLVEAMQDMMKDQAGTSRMPAQRTRCSPVASISGHARST